MKPIYTIFDLGVNSILDFLHNPHVQHTYHPIHKNLIITNYTRQTQYDKLWNNITLNCRSLIWDSETGNIIAKSFPKFFNFEELDMSTDERMYTDIFKSDICVYDKIDGSLITIFKYKNEWIAASKSSFTSIHAQTALNIWNETYVDTINGSKYSDHIFVFELTGPGELKIVIDYGDTPKLTLLTVLNSSFHEYIYDDIYATFSDMDFNIVKAINMSKIVMSDMKLLIGDDAEGYVFRTSENHRFKLKGETYCKLHALYTKTNTRTIYELVKDTPFSDIGLIMDALKLPDEFDDWIKRVIKVIILRHDLIYNMALQLFQEVITEQQAVIVSRGFFVHTLKNTIETFKQNQKHFKQDSIVFDKLFGLCMLIYDGKKILISTRILDQLCKPLKQKPISFLDDNTVLEIFDDMI